MRLGIRANQTVWTPERISTALWLDAADSSTMFDSAVGGNISSVGGVVKRWLDKSPNGFIASNTGSNCTLLGAKLNGINSIKFSSFLDIPSITIPQPFQFFIVAGEGTNFGYLFDNINGVNRVTVGLGLSAAFNLQYSAFGGSLIQLSSGFNGSVSSFLATTVFNGTNSVIFKDGDFIEEGELGVNSISSIRLGSRFSNSFIWGGYISEIIFVQGLDNRTRVEGYLAHKWGLTANLPSDHPYKNYPPRGL